MPARRLSLPFLLAAAVLLVAACARPEPQGTAARDPAATTPSPAHAPDTPNATMAHTPTPPPTGTSARQLATFGGGCFWCTEAVFERLDGVLDVTSGYAGGELEAPTYAQICTGTTGHAEVVQVAFDPAKVTYAALLDLFFRAHDPTTLNRQGPDQGTQYRSVVFTHSDAQHTEALAAIERAQPRFADPIVTQVSPAPTFWPAEEKHQDYFRKHPDQGYCRVMIAPKLEKLGLDDD